MVEWLKSCEDVVPDMTTMMGWIIEGPVSQLYPGVFQTSAICI